MSTPGFGAVHSLDVSPAYHVGGQFRKIDFPRAIETRCNATSDALEIVGRYTDATGKIHGFVAK